MPIAALIEFILGVIAIIVGFFVVIGGLIVLEILYYINGLELETWQEWGLVLFLPYVLFRILYSIVSRFKTANDY